MVPVKIGRYNTVSATWGKEDFYMLGTVLLVILILMLLGVIPVWGHSRAWGYWPSGVVGTILLIVLILLLMGRI